MSENDKIIRLLSKIDNSLENISREIRKSGVSIDRIENALEQLLIRKKPDARRPIHKKRESD